VDVVLDRAPPTIVTKRFASPMIGLHGRLDLETSCFKAEVKTTSA
jgi:hypothetical protein